MRRYSITLFVVGYVTSLSIPCNAYVPPTNSIKPASRHHTVSTARPPVVTPEDAAIAKAIVLVTTLNNMLKVREKTCVHIWVKSVWTVYDEVVEAIAEINRLFAAHEQSFKDESTRMLFAQLKNIVDTFHTLLEKQSPDLERITPLTLPHFDTTHKEWGGDAITQETPILHHVAEKLQKQRAHDHSLSVIKETAEQFGTQIDLMPNHAPVRSDKKPVWSGWIE